MNCASRSRATAAFCGPRWCRRLSGSILRQSLGNIRSSMLRLRSMSTRISAPYPVRAICVSGRPGPASASTMLNMARTAKARHRKPAMRPNGSAGNHGRPGEQSAYRAACATTAAARGARGAGPTAGRNRRRRSSLAPFFHSPQFAAERANGDRGQQRGPAPKKRWADCAKNCSIAGLHRLQMRRALEQHGQSLRLHDASCCRIEGAMQRLPGFRRHLVKVTQFAPRPCKRQVRRRAPISPQQPREPGGERSDECAEPEPKTLA